MVEDYSQDPTLSPIEQQQSSVVTEEAAEHTGELVVNQAAEADRSTAQTTETGSEASEQTRDTTGEVPESVNQDEQGQVEDVSRAWDMAHAGKELRDKASENRELEGRKDSVKDRMHQTRDIQDNIPSKLHPISRRKQTQDFKSAHHEWLDAEDELRSEDYSAEEEARLDLPGEP